MNHSAVGPPSLSSSTAATNATCQHIWREDLSRAAEPHQKISRTGLRWALNGLMCQQLSISRIAQGLYVTWNTATDAVRAEDQRVLINDPNRLEGVKVVNVDEHVWPHTKTGENYVRVIMDLAPFRDQTGASRLLDRIPGNSKAVFETWLASQDKAWEKGVELVAMEGFNGFKTSAAEELADAVEVLDPFHVSKLGSEALDQTQATSPTRNEWAPRTEGKHVCNSRRTLTQAYHRSRTSSSNTLRNCPRRPSTYPHAV